MFSLNFRVDIINIPLYISLEILDSNNLIILVLKCTGFLHELDSLVFVLYKKYSD